jgi:hypothetical protein
VWDTEVGESEIESGLQLLAFFAVKPQVAFRYNILATILAALARNYFPFGYFLIWCLVWHITLRTFLLAKCHGKNLAFQRISFG